MMERTVGTAAKSPRSTLALRLSLGQWTETNARLQDTGLALVFETIAFDGHEWWRQIA